MIFRNAVENDVDEIVALEEVCFDDAWSETLIYEAVVKDPTSKFLLAYNEDKLIGYIGYVVVEGECQIYNVAVSPDHRRKGVARALVEKIFEESYPMGVTMWTLEVRVGNEAAIALYKELGFKIVGTRPRYYDNGEDAFLMTKGQIDGM